MAHISSQPTCSLFIPARAPSLFAFKSFLHVHHKFFIHGTRIRSRQSQNTGNVRGLACHNRRQQDYMSPFSWWVILWGHSKCSNNVELHGSTLLWAAAHFIIQNLQNQGTFNFTWCQFIKMHINANISSTNFSIKRTVFLCFVWEALNQDGKIYKKKTSVILSMRVRFQSLQNWNIILRSIAALITL